MPASSILTVGNDKFQLEIRCVYYPTQIHGSPDSIHTLYLNIIVFNTIVLFFRNALYFIALTILLSRRYVGHTGQGLGDYLMVAAVTVVVSDTEEDVISLGNTISKLQFSGEQRKPAVLFLFSFFKI